MNIKLQAQIRDLKENLDKNQVPAVIYGAGVKNKVLKVKRLDLEKAFAQAGESNLIDLDIDGKVVKVLVKEVQYDPIKDIMYHIDFYQVDMTKKITTEIPLHFIGESKAVKELGGMLVKNINHIEVECLPSDLVDHIDVDISVITEFHQPIKISDLHIGQGLEVKAEPEEIVANVAEPKEEEVFAAPAPTAEEAAATAAAAAATEGKTETPEANKDKGKEKK